MQADRHSRTALLVAFIRAQHHLHETVKIFDDPYAHRLLTDEEIGNFADVYARDALALGMHSADRPSLVARALREVSAAPIVLSRARYAEDRLALAVDHGVEQYVLVGAGLDTFAFRRPDLGARLQVFELDHPQSQQQKRVRLARAGLAAGPNLHFTAIDFERDEVAEVLRRGAFRPEKPAVFAWLGVTYYLTKPAIERALHALASVAAPGSELVFDSYPPSIFLDSAPAFVQRMLERTRALGEPLITGLDRATVELMLGASGWSLHDWLDLEEIDRRFFSSRTDNYRARTLGQLACVCIPPRPQGQGSSKSEGL